MSRTKWRLVVLLLLAGAAALVGYYYYYLRPAAPPPTMPAVARPGLGWLPAEAGLVAGVELATLREQEWLLALLDEAGGEVEQEPDYRAYVAATGFDYGRDLDAVWLSLFGASQRPHVAGVAEGRFNRRAIVAYARQQGATVSTSNGGVEIYEVPLEGSRGRNRFAFAFLDEARLAFGSDSERVRQVLACAAGRAASVGADEARRAEIEQASAGQQAWLINDPARWPPPTGGFNLGEEKIDELLSQLVLGLRVEADRLEVSAQALFHEQAQAESWAGKLKMLLLLGRGALSVQRDEAGRALGRALGELALGQEGRAVWAHLPLSRETLRKVLLSRPLTRGPKAK